MSDNEGSKAKSGWTDKERLTYLFALIDNSNVKFDYNATPRPIGRSIIACQRMMERLKGTLKNELEALKSGMPIDEGTPKKAAGTPKSSPRKRKAKVDGEEDATPTKKGRKKKGAAVDEKEEIPVKPEKMDDELIVEDDD